MQPSHNPWGLLFLVRDGGRPRVFFKRLGKARFFTLWPGGAGTMAVEREMWCSQVPWSENAAHSNTRLAGMVERSPLLSPKSNIPTQQGIEELPGHAAVQGEGPKGRGLKQRHSLQNDRRLETSRAEKKACNFLPSLAKVSQLKHQKCRARSFALCLEWLECVASHTIYFRRWQKTHHMPRSCGTGTRRNARPGTKPCRLLLNDVKDKKKADARCFKSEM